MKIIVNEADKHLRFWGVEPAQQQDLLKAMSLPAKRELRETLKRQRDRIKKAGFVPKAGLLTEKEAVELANMIEQATSIEMAVYKHDFI